MSAKTRIWVFHMKELIYTAVFVVLGIFFLLLLIFMFSPDQTAQTSEESPSPYTAGIYTTSLMLGGNPVEIAITVDQDYISSIRFRTQSLENLSYSEDSQYTSLMLVSAIKTALAKAEKAAP